MSLKLTSKELAGESPSGTTLLNALDIAEQRGMSRTSDSAREIVAEFRKAQLAQQEAAITTSR